MVCTGKTHVELLLITYHKVQDLHPICHGNLTEYYIRNVGLCSSHRYTGIDQQGNIGVDR